MIRDLLEMNISPITRTILTCSAYAKQDLEDTCFLKSADAARAMKSDIVSDKAPTAVSWDWLWNTED